MDTEPTTPVSNGPPVMPDATSRTDTANASAIIGSDAFVQRVLHAMTLGAQRAIKENAALEHRPTTP